MAQLKDLVVTGPSRLIGNVYTSQIQLTEINAPTASNGTTYGPGSNGQVLKSNGTSVYWAADNNTTYSSQAAASGGTAVSLCTTGEKYTWNDKYTKSEIDTMLGDVETLLAAI